MKSKGIIILVLGILGTVFFTGCVEPSMYTATAPDTADPAASLADLYVEGSSFTLAWNPADPGTLADPLVGYNVYYRNHGTDSWQFLTDSPDEQVEVTSAMLPGGDYEFAVTAYSAVEETPLHTSLDSTADPSSGWYLTWVQ